MAVEIENNTFNITPNPRILEVIANNPMPPINALCELIDNSLDGFTEAGRKGNKIEEQIIVVDLPGRKDIDNGTGRLIIKDNGPGLSKEETNNALRAGYSGNNAFENLGLFGVGFNIATAKLGAKTVFKTARKEDDKVLCAEIDIPALVRNKSFEIPFRYIPKPSHDYSGVEIEISDWWPGGNANAGYAKKLVTIGVPQLTKQIGRRYTTLLRKNLKILINGTECTKYYHCVWDKKRFVERNGKKIQARYNFNEDLGTEIRCYTCGNLVEEDHCPECGELGDVRPREKVIKGWVGIQRYDDPNKYGIDFIRNGRAILIDEKEAVFSWTTESTGEKKIEYPVDGIYGRIVGEVHINHVPTDFMKTEFQRTHSEWSKVMQFIRGESSFHPKTQAANNEPENESPLFKLFQGYRRVRTPGRTDMYMGYWDSVSGQQKRVSRDIEEEYKQKFLDNVPGFGPKDDSKWWEKVEAADLKPAQEMKTCPECGYESSKDSDVCNGCGHIYLPKDCINCKEKIPLSAASCPHCGQNQIPDEETSWLCTNCMKHNPPDAFKCRKCGLPRGVPDNFLAEYLEQNSDLIEELSRNNISLSLPGDIPSPSVRLSVYQIGESINLEKDGYRVPAVVDINSAAINLFLDQRHPIFLKYQSRPEDIISIELAKWVRQHHESKITDQKRALWTISNLFYLIQSQIWGKSVELDAEEVGKEVKEFFNRLSESLPVILQNEADNIYELFEKSEKSSLIIELNLNNMLEKQKELIENGEYLSYLPIDLQIKLFNKYPDKFFKGNFWKDDFDEIDADPTTIQKIKESRIGMYYRCLDDMFCFINFRNPDNAYIQKINHTLKMVQNRLA